jgi:CO/xanthine dehydrogenase Mo-binding subunit
VILAVEPAGPIDQGRVTALSLADYKMPAVSDIPRMQAVTIESEWGVGPFNVKGIGENPVIPVAPSIANAIEDAAVGLLVTVVPTDQCEGTLAIYP